MQRELCDGVQPCQETGTDEMGDDGSERGFECDHAEWGCIELLHFLFERSWTVPRRNDIDRSIAQSFQTGFDMISRTQRWVQLGIGVEGRQRFVGQFEVRREDPVVNRSP